MSVNTAEIPVTQQHQQQWRTNGYFIVRNAVDSDGVDAMRRVILEFVTGQRSLDSMSELVQEFDAMPMDELKDKLRKLSGIGRTTPEMWNGWYANPRVLSVVRQFLGDTIYLKYDSVFLKPAKVGGATPWHQDIGLWLDTNTDAFNAWLAVDPATKENGCLQFIPGTHRTEVITHVKYPDQVHGELPRRLVERTIAEHGVDHIELAPGDCVMWHSHLWHFSPPNTSNKRRIGAGAVWISPAQSGQLRMKQFVKAMDNGRACAFPPEAVELASPGLNMQVHQHLDRDDIV